MRVVQVRPLRFLPLWRLFSILANSGRRPILVLILVLAENKVVAHSLELILINRVCHALMGHRTRVHCVWNRLFKAYAICEISLQVFIQHCSLILLIVYVVERLLIVLSTLHRFVVTRRVAQREIRPSQFQLRFFQRSKVGGVCTARLLVNCVLLRLVGVLVCFLRHNRTLRNSALQTLQSLLGLVEFFCLVAWAQETRMLD
jgi:hypothetical protein